MDWDSKVTNNKAMLLGSSYNVSGLIGLRIINENEIAILNSVGNNPNHRSEDSVGGLIDDTLGISLAVIADSHFGGLIADAMIISFIQNYDRALLKGIIKEKPDSEIIKGFKEFVIEKINEALTEVLPLLKEETNETTGDTTLIVTIKYNQNLYWISIGDSFLYVFSNDNYELLNSRRFNFLGLDNAAKIDLLLDFGVYNLEDDSMIVLTTDGLIQSLNKNILLDASDLIGLVEYNNPHLTIKNFIHTAFVLGGNENMGIICT